MYPFEIIFQELDSGFSSKAERGKTEGYMEGIFKWIALKLVNR